MQFGDEISGRDKSTFLLIARECSCGHNESRCLTTNDMPYECLITQGGEFKGMTTTVICSGLDCLTTLFATIYSNKKNVFADSINNKSGSNGKSNSNDHDQSCAR